MHIKGEQTNTRAKRLSRKGQTTIYKTYKAYKTYKTYKTYT